MFVQLLLNGLLAGAIYSLAAAGFSVIYSTCKFVHFAHGVIIIISGYLLFYFFALSDINFWLSCSLAILLTTAIGYCLNHFIYKPLRRRKTSSSVLLITSLGLMTIFEASIMLFFGADVKTINFLKISRGVNILGGIITPLQIAIVTLSIILFIFLLWFMKSTKLGIAMRATANNKDAAEIVGISSEKIYGISFVIGSALAGIAGILIAMEQNLEPSMGTNLMVKAFAASIIGGIGSIPGAIMGALMLGLAENLGIWFLPSGYKDAIAFVILFIFLLFRPQGIFSANKGKK